MRAAFVLTGLFHAAMAFNPLNPTADYSYTIEAKRSSNWPACRYRFLSFPGSCDSVDLWSDAGENQQFELQAASNGEFLLMGSCGRYLSYSNTCGTTTIGMTTRNTATQRFKFTKTAGPGAFEFNIEAMGRADAACATKWISFSASCSTSGPDQVSLSASQGVNQRFSLHPVGSKTPMRTNPQV
jgi:hypothetical protein